MKSSLLSTGTGPRRSLSDATHRGAILPLMASMMVVFLILCAFTVDSAYMQLVRTELRASTDASAKAAAEALARLQNRDAAYEVALAVASQNNVAGTNLRLAPEDVHFGRTISQPDGTWTFEDGATPYTAVKVNGRFTTDSLNGVVPLFFAGVLGKDGYAPVHSAVAAHMENEIVLAVDRSHSMAFDLSGVDWSYPPSNPYPPTLKTKTKTQWKIDLATPPHPTASRWAQLDNAIDVFIAEVSVVSQPPRVALVTWASNITRSSTEYSVTGLTSPAVTIDAPLSLSYSPITVGISHYGSIPMLGGTDIAAGINSSISILTAPTARPLANKTIVLLTDGQWTQGSDPRTAAGAARDAGILIYTVTFLDSADQSLMQDVADIAGGRHYHASDAAQLEAAFREIARSLPVALVN